MTLDLASNTSRRLRRVTVSQARLVLAAAAIFFGIACDSETEQVETACEHEWRDREQAVLELEQLVGFDVITPDYLPESTLALPEVTTYAPNDEVELRFPACETSGPGILGPQVFIRETTRDLGLAEPGTSNPKTERIDIEGTPVILQKQESGTRVFVSMSWKQGGLSLWSTIDWASGDGEPTLLTAGMEEEARRVVESIIRQSDGGS